LVQGKTEVSQTFCYTTHVEWIGEHKGHLHLGNGPEMDFSAPPDAMGISGVLTPEDAFVAAVNSCIMLMFLWSCERLKIALVSYRCTAEGTKLISLDHTETFTQVKLTPEIRVKAGAEPKKNIEERLQKAIKSAQKYSLVANSIKSDVIIEPMIEIIP
jgi:organic hydroperoxide reductase OsmC/OhrA